MQTELPHVIGNGYLLLLLFGPPQGRVLASVHEGKFGVQFLASNAKQDSESYMISFFLIIFLFLAPLQINSVCNCLHLTINFTLAGLH